MRIKAGQKIIDKLRGKKEGASENCTFVAGEWHPMPPKYKQNNIIEYAKEYNCKTFIETGTYLGDTTNAVKDCFDVLYTVELSKELYENIKTRFKNEPKIHHYNGNSKDVLPEIINKITATPLFWLDAHYSGGTTAQASDKDTPILEELEIILEKCEQCVILIDDARCFGTFPDYPSIFKLKRFVLNRVNNAEIEIYNDIIRIIINNQTKHEG